MSKVLVVDDDRATRHLAKSVLAAAGITVVAASGGREALQRLARGRFDLILLDVWMPRLSGLDVLERLGKWKAQPKVIMITSDDTPATLLKATRHHAHYFVKKPIEARSLVALVKRVLRSGLPPAIEVVSARPDWVEVIAPCTRAAARRVQAVVAHMDAGLEPDVRDSVGSAFRELLLNAVEWGGKLDPNRKVRIAYLRARRMLMYRIADPGRGFSPDALQHAAVGQTDPLAHVDVREARGLRPGGFGLMMVRESADELLYNERRNEVVFVKYLDQQG
ncbi:MAG TPA: response regulator [Vicinamibacterales bacterium]|jgi:CheY-like chemotaxis protein|nr:response regulator [Vicinamibacterales bacterium]